MDDAEDALGIMAQTQLNMGVTSFLPTTMTYDFPRIYRAFERISQARENTTSARILGANMEGPFISKKYKGAQAEENIINADFSLIEKIHRRDKNPDLCAGGVGGFFLCKKMPGKWHHPLHRSHGSGF